MLIWLNGNQNVKGRPERELRARDDGAVHARRRPRRLHGDRRARAGARAHRLDGRRRPRRDRRTSPSSTTATTPGRRRSSGRPANFHLERLGRPLPQHPLHPSFFVNKLWSYFIPTPPDKPTAAGLAALYTRNGFKVHPVVEAILQHPDFYFEPADGQVRRSCSTRACCERSAATSTPRRGGRRAPPPASSSSTLPTWAAGTTRAGSTLRPGGRAGSSPRSCRAPRRRPTRPSDPDASSSPARSLSGATRRSRPRRTTLLVAFAKAQLQAQRRPGRRRDGPAPARRLLPRPPDRMIDLLPRLQHVPRSSAVRWPRQGAGCRGSSRECRIPAGTGLTRPRLRLPHRRPRARHLRRRGALGARVRGRDRGRGDGATRRTCWSSSTSRAASTGSRCSSRRATRCTTRCGRTSRSRRQPGRRSRRTTGCAGTRRPAGSRRCTARGRSRCIPAIGYVNNDESHFTSRHYWEVGAPDATLRTGWLGRYLDARGRGRQPDPGALARHRAPAGARDHEDARGDAVRPPTSTRSRRPGLPAHPLEPSMLQEAANIGAAHATSSDAGLATAGRSRSSRTISTPSSARSSTGSRAPSPYPATTDPFPHRLAGLAAMIAAGLPLRVVTITSPGHFDTHASQAAALTSGLQLTSDSLLAFQRDLEARGVADRVIDLRLVGVRAPRGRERVGRDRPRLGRDRLPDRDEGGRPA